MQALIWFWGGERVRVGETEGEIVEEERDFVVVVGSKIIS